MSENWESKHKELGYDTEFNMFHDLYVEQKMTLRELTQIMGVGINTIRQHLQACGINRRPRGGQNRLGMSRVRLLPDEALLKIEESAVKYNLHPSALYKEKRRRKELVSGSQSGTGSPDPGGELASEQDLGE